LAGVTAFEPRKKIAVFLMDAGGEIQTRRRVGMSVVARRKGFDRNWDLPVERVEVDFDMMSPRPTRRISLPRRHWRTTPVGSMWIRQTCVIGPATTWSLGCDERPERENCCCGARKRNVKTPTTSLSLTK
jgi:hypothetical protein